MLFLLLNTHSSQITEGGTQTCPTLLVSFWGRIWLHLRHILQTPSKGPTLSQINKCCRKSPFPNGNVATRWSCQTDLRHPTLPLGARGHTQGLVTGDKHPFPGSSGSKSLRFQGSSQGRAALLTAFCRPCRPAASTRTLQQACSSLTQQACRPLQQADSCRVCRLSASLQTLQQPAGQQRLRATCRPCRTPPLQTLQQACKTCCLPLPQPAWFPVFNYLGIFLHSHRVHFPL